MWMRYYKVVKTLFILVLKKFIKLISHIPKVRGVFYTLFLFWPDWPKPLTSELRAIYWRTQFKYLGENSRISHKVKVQNAENITLGRDTHITNNVILNGIGGIEIGNDVLVGYETIIMTSGRKFSSLDIPIRKQGSELKKVVIGNDVWLGTRVIVLPGVTVGDGAVIGSGAVITKDIPPYSVAVGVPARVVRKRL
jgi:maltose O-acetyltransferase